MVNHQRRRLPKLRYLTAVSVAVAACFSVSVSTAYANPSGFAVVNGQVTFNYNGNTLSVTNTPGSIINWQGFSIGANELTRFIQQSAASSVLNRVVGADPSRILGALQSNGRVFLINPSGIVFGAGAQVDVAGLVASTLNLSNADFLAGRFRFTEVPGAGSVVNQGSITTSAGGQVYLIAPNVQNSGIITSPRGEVILAAGRSVQLVDAGTPGLRVEVTAPDNEAVNVGQIMAASGKVGIYAGLIRAGGAIRADGVVAGENGEILLKATQSATVDAGATISASGAHGGKVTIQSGDTTFVSGTVEAKGSEGKGGTVQLLGHLVGVTGNAVVDASGQAGGGTVLVGGDYQGRNPDVQNAYRTYVGPSAAINADAIASGDGGKVIVWSDDATRVYGSISARGGAQSGDGGFVETSGHRLEVTKGPNVTAPRGAAGTWLLDPVDLSVVPGSGLANNTAAPFFDPLGETSSVGVDLINSQLDFGSNVVLTTTSQGPADGAQAGNITVSAPILKKAATTTGPGGIFIGTTSLTMTAHNNIVIDGAGSITSTGDPLNVILSANNFSGTGNGGVTVGGAITTNGGFVDISGRGPIAVNAPISTLRNIGGGNNISLSSSAGAVNVAAAISGSFFFADGFTGVSISGPVTSPSGVELFSGGPIMVGAPVSGGFFDAETFGPGATLTLAAAVTSTGAFLLADNMDIQAALNAGSGGITVQQNTSGRPVDLGTNTAGSLSLTQAALNNLVTSGSLSIGAFNTGAITVSAPLTATLPSDVNVIGASIIQNAPVNITGPLTVTTDNVTINSTLTVGGNVTIEQRSFFRAINLGAVADSGTALDISSAELNSIFTPAGLRIGNFSSGALTIVNPIAPANVSTLSLTSGSQITQSAGATITVANLALNTSGSVSLPEANSVGTLAGSASGFGGGFSFSNAAGTPLTIGTVDGTNGVSFNNSNGTINLSVDNLTVASFISACCNGAVVIQPVLATTKLDLGGADAAGVLGISAAELANIFATTLTLKADQTDISAAVASSVSTFVIAPRTVGRALNIVGGAKNPANLELLPSELGNVTAGSLVLGDLTTGPVTVSAATAIPGSVGIFTLRSGDTATGITLNNTLSASNDLALLGDTMNLNFGLSSSGGSISIATNTGGRPIDLGSKPANTLGLNAGELGLITASNGPLFVGNSAAGNLTVSAPITFSTIGDLNLTTGGTLAINAALSNTSLGSINLTANAMTVGAAVTGGGDINVAPQSFRSITLGTDDTGSTLGFTAAELNNLAAAGALRIGNFSTTNNISVTAAIAPANTTILSLVANGSISQTAGSTITETNLRAESFSSINLPEANSVGTLAGSSSGSFSFTNAVPLTIGTVDGASGISDSAVTLRSNEISINADIFASNVTLKPLTAGTLINIGTNVGGQHSFDQTELNHIFATGVTIGDGNSGNLVVSAPVSISTFSDLTLTTGAARTVSVNAALDVPGNLTVGGGTINTVAALTSSFGNINLVADSMTFGAPVSAPSGTISLGPVLALTDMNIGGPDVVSTTNTLGLDATDLAALSAAALSFGLSYTPSISVTATTNLGATPTSLITAGAGTINVNAALTTGNLSLTTDNLVVLTGSLAAPNVTLNTVSGGRTVDLGTAITGTALGLDQAQLDRITTPGTFAINNAGLINVSAPVSFANAANLTLHGDTMTIGSTVTSPVGGRIIVAPASSFRPMNLGTNPAGGALGLTPLEITQFVTTGVLQLGDHDTATGSINISNSIAPAAGVSALVLATNGSITQSAGNIITAPNLRIDSFGSVNLPEANSVGTLAGSSSSSFTFTGAGALNIGTVDGASGISDSTVTLKADTLTLSQAISAFNVTLAPRNAGAPIDLGSKPAGVFGVTDAEMDLISASFLTFGNSTAGPVNVSSAMSGASGTLNIVTGAAQSVSVNAGLSGQSNVSVTGGTINISAPLSSTFGSVTLNALAPTTLNVNAAVTARFNVAMTSDVINIGAPVTSTFGSVTFQPQTANRPIDLGSENAAALSITAAEVNQVTAPSLVIGNTSAGPLTVTAPIAPTGVTNLFLQSGGAITQSPGATIVTRKVVNDDLQGGLSVTARGVDLREANDVGEFLSGNAFGSKSDFFFNNVSPLKLQQVSVSFTGKRRINAGLFEAPIPTSEFDESLQNSMIVGLDRSTDFSAFDKDKDKDKKKDEEKKSDEKQINKGLNAMCKP